MKQTLRDKIEALRMSDAGTARGAARQFGWNGALYEVLKLVPLEPRKLSADEFEELALMGTLSDGTLALGEGASARMLDHARSLVEAQAANVRRLQIARIGDAENIGRELSRAEKLAEIVKRFAAHPVDCRSALDKPCSCGLTERLAEVGVELAE